DAATLLLQVGQGERTDLLAAAGGARGEGVGILVVLLLAVNAATLGASRLLVAGAVLLARGLACGATTCSGPSSLGVAVRVGTPALLGARLGASSLVLVLVVRSGLLLLLAPASGCVLSFFPIVEIAVL